MTHDRAHTCDSCGADDDVPRLSFRNAMRGVCNLLVAACFAPMVLLAAMALVEGSVPEPPRLRIERRCRACGASFFR